MEFLLIKWINYFGIISEPGGVRKKDQVGVFGTLCCCGRVHTAIYSQIASKKELNPRPTENIMSFKLPPRTCSLRR